MPKLAPPGDQPPPVIIVAVGSFETRTLLEKYLGSAFKLIGVNDQTSALAAILDGNADILLFDHTLTEHDPRNFLSTLRADARNAGLILVQILAENDARNDDEEPDFYLPLIPKHFLANLNSLVSFARLKQQTCSPEATADICLPYTQQLQQAEANALANERRLRLFLENAKDYAMLLMDPENRIVEWLGAAEAITGWTADEQIGKPIHVLFTREDREGFVPEKELEKAAAVGRAEDIRWHVKKDSSLFFAEGVTTAFRDEAGNLQGFGKIFRDATAQKLADEALQQSRTQFQLLLDSVGEGICGLDANGNCAFLNPAGADMLGYRPDELVGQSAVSFLCEHSVISPTETNEILAAVQQHYPLRGDNGIFWRKNGTPIPVQYTVNPLRPNDDRAGMVIAFTDISHHLRAEAETKENARRLKFVMDSVPEKLFTANPQGRLSYVNSKAYEFAGFSADGEKTWAWVQMLHPDDLERSVSNWWQAVNSGADFEIEHRFRRHDGRYRWHLTRALPMRDEHGQVVMWVGSNTDIHDVKTTEVDLVDKLAVEQQNTARLTELADASRAVNSVLSVGCIAKILAGEARRILRTHQTVVSLSKNQEWVQSIHAVSLSEKYAGYQHYDEVPDGSGIYAEVCRQNKPLRLTQPELEQHPLWRGFGKHADQHPPMRGWLAVPLIDHSGKNLGVIQASDKEIGEFTAEDEAILLQLAAIASVGIENATLYDSLREQDRRKDEFLATLAHELRNPLAPLRTGLDLLAADNDIAQNNQIRKMMQRQLAHMVRLIDDLMDVSRVSSGKVELKSEPVSLRTILEAALEVTEPTIRAAGHQLYFQLPENQLCVRGDPTRLAQIVSNLINNAAKYTPPGGTIHISAEREGDQVAIRITDTGVGIAKEMLTKVFDLFTQVDPSIDRSQGGLGIGLSLVQKLVALHGGSVMAESPGLTKGSTFIVRLPLLIENPAAAAATTQDHVAAHVTGKRVLVVDDNIDAAEALAMLLRLSGHEVLTAHSGTNAVDSALRFHPDVIFLDLGLPGLNGYEVAMILRKEPSLVNLILIALTGWGNDEDRRRAREAGFDFHLVKPADAATVNAALEQFFLPEP
jgi:PAS domain S-box-containing protein